MLPFDLSTRTVGPALQGHSGGYTPSLAVDGDRLLVADRGTEEDLDAAGLLVFDAATGAKLAGPISTGLPPSSIAVLADPAPYTAVTDETTAGAGALPLGIRLGDAYPNPFNGGTQIPFTVAQAQPAASLLVRDALGQLVRTFALGGIAAGDRALQWDGRDDAGRPVGNGAYLVELRAGQSVQVAKVMLLK